MKEAMRRIGFAIAQGLRHRRALREILALGSAAPALATLSPGQIAAPDLVLILDFDGVLAPHADDTPTPVMATWLAEAVRQLGPERVFLLSNRPRPARAAWLAAHCPGVRLIHGVAKKPYPHGLQRIAEMAGVPPERVILVDDRLLTGGLAAVLAGARCHYVRRPLIRLWRRPVRESFFQCLRLAERLLIAHSRR
jgi:hypothetical protein